MINSIYFNTKSPTLPGKIAKLLVSIVVVGLGLMFSALLLVIIVTAGAMIWGYLWWKSRDLREQMRQYSSSDVVIEGEVIRRESDEHPIESTLEKLENLSSLRSDKQMGTF